MKNQAKEQSIQLRTDGHSIGYIAKELNISKSSVSTWVRNIELTVEQKDILKSRNPVFNRYYDSSKSIIIRARNKRYVYQEEGRHLVQNSVGEKRDLLISGCMLYWGEGSKKRNTVTICNSDADLLEYFISFLTTIFGVDIENILLTINCHTDIHSIEEIEKYWLSRLSLNKSSCRKHYVNYFPESKKGRKLPYGIATITVHNSRLMQQIYGAIQEISGFDNNKWVE
jgi:hypothetical protein